MADFIMDLRGQAGLPSGSGTPEAVVEIGPKRKLLVYGEKGTFSIVRKGEDSIIALGYVCHSEVDSMEKSLQVMLASFQEPHIEELKRKLIGQFVLIIKKGSKIHVFSDFMGGRNIFYSESGDLAASSFSQLESIIGPEADDLIPHKVLEYLAVRHVLYPSLHGRSTFNKKIKWLYPFEYIALDDLEGSLSVKDCVFRINNEKQPDPVLLADSLLQGLRGAISREEFRGDTVAASLTGGRDSRLVAIIAAECFPKVRFRTAVSQGNRNSLRDMRVARKVAKLKGVPLDVYEFRAGVDENNFIEATEGFAPAFNHAITPVINSAGNYSLGLGGVFGTELFTPIKSKTIKQHINDRIENVRVSLFTDNDFWEYFGGELEHEFEEVKKHYVLSQHDERDYIRMFNLLNTARYGSFIMSAFNKTGLQLEPYGQFRMLELALKVAPELWGDHKTVRGDALVQKVALSRLDRRVAKVITYSSFRPMLPFSARSAPLYLFGYGAQLLNWGGRRLKEARGSVIRTELPWGHYFSNGWERPFTERLARKYGVIIRRVEIKSVKK
jgi:hypothetical protein